MILIEEVEIMFINKNEYYYEVIWLYEVLVGILNYEDVLYFVESVLKKDKVNFV